VPVAEISGSSGIAFLVAAGVAYEIIAKDVSSPQTTELNAHARAPTLMKWVHIGQAESALMIIVAAAIDRKHRAAIMWGGLLAMAITEAEYVHAKSAGLAGGGPPTETWTPPGPLLTRMMRHG